MSITSISQRSIVAREEDAATIDVSWPEMVDLVRCTLRRIVGPSRDLDDLTQAALERAFRALPKFEGRSEVRTFVYRITVNVALNHWRSWRRWLRRFDPTVDITAADPEDDTERSPPQALHQRRRAARVRMILDRLDADKRIVIVLADFEELPASQIARILGCGEPTVRSRLRLARARLAELVFADPFFAEEVSR